MTLATVVKNDIRTVTSYLNATMDLVHTSSNPPRVHRVSGASPGNWDW